MLSKKNKDVEVVILTSQNSNLTKLDINKFNKQYPTLKVAITNKFHDRFIVIDNKELYHCGASLKDLGKKCFALSKMNDIEYIKRLEEAFRIKKFKKLYNEFFIDKEFIEINDDIFEPIFKDKKTGSLLKVNELSSGEKQIFFRGGSLLENIEDNTIVLIDEPKTSLHPEWQQRILEFYKNINQDNQYIF